MSLVALSETRLSEVMETTSSVDLFAQKTNWCLSMSAAVVLLM